MEICSLITDKIHRFFRALDDRDYDALVGLLADDGVWHRQGRDLTTATIGAAMAERSVTMVIRHVVTNLIVDGDDERADLSFLLTVYRSDNGAPLAGPVPLEGPAQINDCTATLVRVGETWLISRLAVPPPVLRRP